MPDLVLDLRGERELSLQRRRAEDPVALGKHPHELGVPVHLDELDELRAVLVGHPVAGLDLAARLDVLQKLLGARIHGCYPPWPPTERSLAWSIDAHPQGSAHPRGGAALRGARVPRHVDGRPGRGPRSPEGLALLADGLEAAAPPRHDAGGRARVSCGAGRGSGASAGSRTRPACSAGPSPRRLGAARRRHRVHP